MVRSPTSHASGTPRCFPTSDCQDCYPLTASGLGLRQRRHGANVALVTRFALPAVTAALLVLPAPAVAAQQEGALLTNTVIARVHPRLSAHAVQRVWNSTPFSERAVILPVIGRDAGGNWLRVRLPSRPNNATGWIPAVRTRS